MTDPKSKIDRDEMRIFTLERAHFECKKLEVELEMSVHLLKNEGWFSGSDLIRSITNIEDSIRYIMDPKDYALIIEEWEKTQ